MSYNFKLQCHCDTMIIINHCFCCICILFALCYQMSAAHLTSLPLVTDYDLKTCPDFPVKGIAQCKELADVINRMHCHYRNGSWWSCKETCNNKETIAECRDICSKLLLGIAELGYQFMRYVMLCDGLD